MATIAYRTFPTNTYGDNEFRSQEDSLSSINYGTYNSANGSLTTYQPIFYSNGGYSIQQKPRYYLRDRYDEQAKYNQDLLKAQKERYQNKSIIRYATAANHTRPRSKTTHYLNPYNQYQTSYTGTAQLYPSASYDIQQGQLNRIRPEYQNSNNLPKQSITTRRSFTNSGNSLDSETAIQRNNFVTDTKINRSTDMRSSVSKPKWNNGNHIPINKKFNPYSSIDDKENDFDKSKRNKNQSHSVPRNHQNRRNDFDMKDNPRNRSIKRSAVSDSFQKKNSQLPPVRRGHDSVQIYPLPYGHPLRGLYASYNGHRHSYEDVYNDRPAPTSHHDPHHKCLECEKRQTKSRFDRHVDDRYTAMDRREQDYDSKKDPMSTAHSQTWKSTDSYLENQRRRTVRDAQGYYFPYKQYTLKDYRDLKKTGPLINPYGSANATNIDRKELAKKRHEYAAQIERPLVDTQGDEQKTPREANDAEKISKRERALEYVKAQQERNRLHKSPSNKMNKSDPTEQYINGLFPEEDEESEVDEQAKKNTNLNDDDNDDNNEK